MLYLFILCASHLLAGFITSGLFLRPVNRTEHLLLTGLTAYVTFYLVPLIVGWGSGYMNAYVLISGALAAMILAGLAWFNGSGSIRQLWQWRAFLHRSWFEWIVWIITLLLLLLLFLAGLALPVRAYDAPAYHMVNPMRWHQTGRFVLDSLGALDLMPQLISSECAPNVKAILPFAVLVFTSDIPGTALTQFPFLLILISAVRATAMRLGAPAGLSSLAALMSVVVPELFLQAADGYADLVFVAGQLAIVWSIIRLYQSPLDLRSVAIPAFGFGILYGAKAAALVSGGALGLLYGIMLIWKAWPQVRWRTPAWVGLGLVLTLGAILATGGPWFIHAWREFQNPIFPFELKVAGTTVLEGPISTAVNSGMVQAFTGATGTQAYWNTLREVWRLPAFSSWSGGLGAGMFIIGIPAIILFLLGAMVPGPASGARRIFALSFLLLTIATPTLAIARFSLFQPVMGAVAFAWLASVMPVTLRTVSTIVAVIVALYDAYMVIPSLELQRKPPALLAYHLLSGDPGAALVDTYPDQYTALDFWKEEVSGPGKKVALHPHNIAVWFAYAPWSPGDILRFREPTGTDDLATWHQDLVLAGVTHVYLQRGDTAWDLVMDNPDQFQLLIQRLDDHWMPMNGPYHVAGWPQDALFAIKETTK